MIFLILNTRNRYTKILLLKLNQLESAIKRMHRGRHNGQT